MTVIYICRTFCKYTSSPHSSSPCTCYSYHHTRQPTSAMHNIIKYIPFQKHSSACYSTRTTVTCRYEGVDSSLTHTYSTSFVL